MKPIPIKNNHLGKILSHSIIWCFFIVTSYLQFYKSPFNIRNDFMLQWVTGIGLFYLNYFYLVPEWLLKKKNWHYFLGVVSIISVLLAIRAIYFLPRLEELPRIFDAAGKEITPNLPFPKNALHLFISKEAIFYLVITSISIIIRTLNEHYSNQRNKLLAETHRTHTELNYLRKQTNPHFLFNSLNSIYALAYKKSDLVPDAIVTLSEMMRYMLYETDNRSVLLEKEINYIKNYIELQKLRLNSIENIVINIHGETRNKWIEPLLLISFIENAFKYGTDYKGAASVKIKIAIEGDTMDFWIDNKIEKFTKDPENSGIGLVNIENRLQLLYPNAHELTINETDTCYSVHLNLKLDALQT